jgi:hypothetical protein
MGTLLQNWLPDLLCLLRDKLTITSTNDTIPEESMKHTQIAILAGSALLTAVTAGCGSARHHRGR